MDPPGEALDRECWSDWTIRRILDPCTAVHAAAPAPPTSDPPSVSSLKTPPARPRPRPSLLSEEGKKHSNQSHSSYIRPPTPFPQETKKISGAHHGRPLPVPLGAVHHARLRAAGLVRLPLRLVPLADRLGLWHERHLPQVLASGRPAPFLLCVGPSLCRVVVVVDCLPPGPIR